MHSMRKCLRSLPLKSLWQQASTHQQALLSTTSFNSLHKNIRQTLPTSLHLPVPWSLTLPQHQQSLSSSSGKTTEQLVEEINELFVAARDEIDYAKEEAETVYFNESVEEARKVVDSCLGKWDALLQGLSEEEKGKIQRSMGLKIEQLKAEFDIVLKLHLEE